MKLQPELRFDDERHHYTWHDSASPETPGLDMLGVSSFLHGFSEPFDSEYWSAHVAQRDGRQVEDVKREWKRKASRACTMGHFVHNHIEESMVFARKNGHFKISTDSSPHAGFIRAYNHFLVEYGRFFETKQLMPELQICWPEARVAGTIDLLCKVKDKWTIIDWKTNEKLETTAYKGKTMKPPFDRLQDVNLGGHYAIQQGTYQVMLEEALGIAVEHLRIVHLKPSGAFEAHELPDCRDAVYVALEDSERILALIAEKDAEAQERSAE